MREEGFWKLIELSRRDFAPNRLNGNQDRQYALMVELLQELPPRGIQEFKQIYYQFHGQAYRYDLWDAAYLIEGGCSDDGFYDFRNWLISMGKENFERVMQDVDSLAEVAKLPGVEVASFEEFSGAARAAFQNKTGFEIPDGPESEYPSKPAGQRTPEEEYPQKFPKCWAVRDL